MALKGFDQLHELANIIGFTPCREEGLICFVCKQVVIDVVKFDKQLQDAGMPEDGISMLQWIHDRYGVRALTLFRYLTLDDTATEDTINLFTLILK
jgi:hypothetical protein